MSALCGHSIENLLIAASYRQTPCAECGQIDICDYCRTCERFYWVHHPGCRFTTHEHDGHRLTLVPFVETA